MKIKASEPTAAPEEKGGESVRSVHRALDVLLAFSRNQAELTASELLQRVNLSRPTLYRLLYTLETKGFVTSSGDPQRFRLGPAVGQLSHVWTTSLDIASIAEPIMRELWTETQETVAVFVEQAERRLCLAEMPSPQPLNFKRGVGYLERLVVGASGRAILAFKPDADSHLERYAQGVNLDYAAVRKELGRIQQLGYALSRNELIDGAVAVAAPFFDNNGVVGSLALFGPSTRLTESAVRKLGPKIINAANQLSVALGVDMNKLA